MKYLYKWLWFINERFSPLTYAVMIFVFLGAHYALYLNFLNQIPTSNFLGILNLLPLVVVTSFFFFKLRLLDEVKDMESDALHHPERPLPRGILSKNEVVKTAFMLMVAEIILFSFYGFWAFLCALIVVSYSLVMYKEFFIKKWLRAHLTTYAVFHTFVVVLISVTIFVSLLGKPFSEIPKEFIYFSFAGWFLFNIFEFGRKTFAKNEERKGVDSYSKIFGKLGAVLLVLPMALLSNLLLGKAGASVIGILFLPLALVGMVGLLYATTEDLYFAKVYRSLTSLYIILAYGIVTLSVMLKF
jgi:4-hydroxybenzoate polyprenyltransferase